MATLNHQAAVDDQFEIDNQELAVDDADSAYGQSVNSETTSIAEVYKGYFENGRRYQSLSDDEYYQPTDDKQWESMEAGHMLMLILDSQRSNTLFRSPISSRAQHIIDIGTGSGEWAIDVADRYPNSFTIHAIDLYPPPREWTAPNCIFEIDDMTKEWSYNHKFDFVHLRHLLGALSIEDWHKLYKQIYDNLEPGGWIEQVEQDIGIYSDDGSLPADSKLAEWRSMFFKTAEAAGRPLDVYATMRGQIEAAGFVNTHQTEYKLPLGPWPQLQVYKDAGRACMAQYKTGCEGWIMWLLTKYGQPTPWTPEEVKVYLANVMKEIDAGWHIYQKTRRVWAQKPYDTEPKPEQEVEVVDLAAKSPSPAPPLRKKQKTETPGEAESSSV